VGGGSGATGLAGTAGGFSQAGSSGSVGVGGSGAAGSGAGGASSGTGGGAGTTGAAGSGGASGIPAVKLVVYLDDWTGGYASWADKVDFSKMTHLNLAFFLATGNNDWTDASGQSDSDIKALVAKAHAAGVKVLVSLGGGGGDTSVVNQYSNPANDDALVSNLDALLTRLNLDGADVDIEKESNGEVGDNYGTFVTKIVAKLRPEGKLVTAAVAPYLQGYMNDDTLHLFDFVNIMTYSTNTGDYTSALDFYAGKNMAKTKLTLGIISESDQHTSVSTTQAITAIAKNYGGVMLWDLAEDSTGGSSVYKALQDSL
jgi:GH18 family chitinase